MIKRALFIMLALSLAFCMTGCEEDSDDGGDSGGVLFINESQHTVTLYTSMFKNPTFDTHVATTSLESGASTRVSYIENVYYDWEPKSTVDANQVSDDKVIFVDK